MKSIPTLNYVNRIVLCMLLSIALNLAVGYYLKRLLSENQYSLTVDALYSLDGTMEMFYDTGDGFNQKHSIIKEFDSNNRIVQFNFDLKREEHLKFLRVDFGSNTRMQTLELNSIVLTTSNKTIFELSKNEISEGIVYLRHVKKIDPEKALFGLETKEVDFDPYFVLKPLNELVFSKWQRILLLTAPWVLLLFVPLIIWINQRIQAKDYSLILSALFIVSIPLKTAWVTFTAILLLAYAVWEFYKRKKIYFSSNRIALLSFFVIPFIFLGNGEFSKLAIPLGFVIFALIGSLMNFFEQEVALKKIYISVFFMLMSVLVANWMLLIIYNGYYYNIFLSNYFTDIKVSAHQTLDWLYNGHTTFLSFFILIGVVFSYDLYTKKELSKLNVICYVVFSLCTLLILGSRFSLFLFLALPFMFALPIKVLSRAIWPCVLVICLTTVYFINHFDAPRAQLWKMTWISFLNKPWFGHGTGTSEVILQNLALAKEAGYGSVLQMNHSHNQFFTYLLENGVLGLIFFLGSFWFIIAKFVVQYNKSMVVASCLILLLMVVESPFRTATPLYAIAFMVSFFSKSKK